MIQIGKFVTYTSIWKVFHHYEEGHLQIISKGIKIVIAVVTHLSMTAYSTKGLELAYF